MTVRKHGGKFVLPFNYMHEDALDYLIEAVSAEISGEPLYPELWDKAALYMYSIVSNHVFQDGNKRTGLEAALIFLRLNGHQLQTELQKISSEAKTKIPEQGNTTTQILFHFTMEMASGKIDLDEAKLWFQTNIVPLENT